MSSAKPISLLVVDDDLAVGTSIRDFLETANYKAACVENAEAAMAHLQSNQVDLVITDIMLPGLNGLQLTDFIKNNHNADVIVMTGYSGEYSYEEAISKGASDLLFKPFRFEELHLRISRVIKERKLSQERVAMLDELQKLAITDGLTHLYNSRHFYSQLEQEVDRSKRYNHPLSLMLMDIDYFKKYNDTHGHLEGDKVLVKLGQCIKSCLRRMDSAYRYGGEEFTVILPSTRGAEALAVAKRISRTIAKKQFNPQAEEMPNITISTGLTAYRPQEALTDFVQRADNAMYISKKKGRNRISVLFENEEFTVAL